MNTHSGIFLIHLYTHVHTHVHTHTHTRTHTHQSQLATQFTICEYRVAKTPRMSLKSQVIFCKRATHYRVVLWKMTYGDTASYASSPPCTTALSQIVGSLLSLLHPMTMHRID